ncbi:type I-E CRISPR-associated protein Cse1/CasA [Methanocella sp. CWC-04]|uniref:Type I-E CRISPR-associated protein Cse1/CasA n=1 Tax=Methanooceanicella nereidis TaxID=2052831 RepID=A0AAP2W5Y5_9EURY|nr:type I-E CRISPR-associated protein Cse1/CasA [Methanocella sp. CWC-04]MCD1294793.1 type I-E CRISPR-associated protein Cse1/CasA [Methanocella sp. CWC-04]
MASYNLLTEPWIGSIDQSGSIRHMGILGTLKESHNLKCIYDPAPPIEFGIYRLLIAFIMDAFNPGDTEDLADILENGYFDHEILDLYATEWGDRFDIFDEKHPFMQEPINDIKKKPPEPVARLMQHLPAGTNVTHFHHGNWEDHAFSYEQCAKGLVTIAPFMTAGGAGLSPSINGSPPWYVLVKGRNLFETIVYNVCVVQPFIKPIGDMPVVWKNGNKLDSIKDVKTFSIPGGLTWRPRIIQLIPEGSVGKCTYSGAEQPGLVRHMNWGPGQKSPEPGYWADPQVSYIKTKEGIRPLRPVPNKELWRDIGPLMLLQHGDYSGKDGKISYERPSVINQFKQLGDTGIIRKEEPLQIEVFGIRTDGKMKIYEWYHEDLNIAREILDKNNAGRLIQDGMDLADYVSYNIRQALKKAYPRNGKSNDKAFDNIIVSAQSSYWRSLKDQFENEFLSTLSKQDENDSGAYFKLIDEWKKILVQEGTKALEKGLGPLDTDGESLKRQVEAMNEFRARTRAALYPDSKKDGKKSRNKKEST